MNDELRAMLVELGMPEETSDEEAQRWLLENADVKVGDAGQKPADGERKDPVIPEAVVAGADGGNVTADSIRNMIGQAVSEAVTGIEQQRREAESKFRSEVDAMIELSGADVPDAEKHRFYSMANADEVRTALINQRAERQESVFHAPGVVTMGAAQIDKHRSAMKTALTMRCIDSNAPVDGSKGRQEAIEKMFPVEQRSKDWEQFRHATILDLAGECIRADGFDTRNMTKEDIAIVALGFGDQIRDQIGQSYRSDSAYHTTGSFPILTQDAINKSMMLGQAEFPSTWRGPMRQGQSATDFKTIHRMQLGAVPNLPVWNDTKDPDQVSVADAEETYAVECYSEALSFNYKALVNDDMDFISRMPFRMSVAAARTVNATAWAQVTGNPTMRDQKALFLATPDREALPLQFNDWSWGSIVSNDSNVDEQNDADAGRKHSRRSRKRRYPFTDASLFDSAICIADNWP